MLILFQMDGLEAIVPTWLRLIVTLAALGLTAFVLLRSKTSKYWKEERDAAVAKAERLTKERDEWRERQAEFEKEVAALKMKTDLSAMHSDLITAVSSNQIEHSAIVSALERVDTTLKGQTEILTEIARRLMRDYGGAAEGAQGEGVRDA